MTCKVCGLETGHYAQHADKDRCLSALKRQLLAKVSASEYELVGIIDGTPGRVLHIGTNVAIPSRPPDKPLS